MRFNFSQRAIYIQVFLAYLGAILVQRLGWELAGWFSGSPHWRNFTENLLGVVFVILPACRAEWTVVKASLKMNTSLCS
ncbi:hypothetical protein [Pseudoalteromonas maricaloris]|uniref:hypothetical protein n=1 Tax=Pseudoalteromonas maricaloris TaxID=184924 RepID=UPI00029A501A|nr:hypothetical protein [Pseudoalteromonas flavipulchra]